MAKEISTCRSPIVSEDLIQIPGILLNFRPSCFADWPPCVSAHAPSVSCRSQTAIIILLACIRDVDVNCLEGGRGVDGGEKADRLVAWQVQTEEMGEG